VYVTLNRKVESGKASWHSLTASDKKLMAEVVAMWTSAANQGHADAQYNLGAVYTHGQGVFQSFEEAARWNRKAAEQRHAQAQLFLSDKYSCGEGVSEDLEEAARWNRKAADQGCSNAQFNLGVIYRDGEGVTQDFEEAELLCGGF
jgi:TPR repeat protein